MTTAASGKPHDGLYRVLGEAPYRVEAVTLVVRDLDALTRFYRDAIGLSVVSAAGGAVRLGAGDTTFLVLRHAPNARPREPREAGLFHTAFLLPGRGDLGAWLLHTEKHGIALTGAADHLVSEAVYLDDPEGNGIEIYVDRPASAWQRDADGSVVMRNERLDHAGLVRAAERPWSGMPPGSCVGHVHLQVGDLDATERFYAGLLGFDVMCRYPGALFLGAGGYHHQLAGNVWNSRGAAVRTEGATGLAEVGLLADGGTLAAARVRCRDAGVSLVEDGDTLVVRDPWGTQLRLRPEPAR
ncbi:VOC family protein [Methylobacterium oxalidis]|uniref:Ring-cleaving dioxygenase n=1 Tax=Methylobacterium oxalidis TaxID=944322 RepID=A0A512J334_9HYPH|nr:VOC family protein [Methylobacterium oxalidis]GEP04387.1 ring-cleaving dioxygenase [Methylobacterium oxalidis]GJE34063.1 Catechol-2,3-dioxygenase [Methylobacterium oxalidis]GLS62759.1 ring-cleaving dioxygenase [Methylobacterium oxalidis]